MTTHLNPRDLPLGHDESCAADLHAVIDSRMLGRNATSWLARAVAGAIRPSRDRPLWDLAHAIAALGLDGPGLIDLTLDPTRTTAAALQDSLGDNPAADERGLTLTEPRPWRCSWTGLSRVLALSEFLLTSEGLSAFAEITGAVGDGLSPAQAPDLARSLAARLASYRRDHMPAAPIERRFRAIRGYLLDADQRGNFTDDDIVAFWQSDASEEVMFTTIVEHFITFERTLAEMGSLSAISDADGLDDIENWEARLEAITLPVVDAPALKAALDTLANMEDGPKLLTGAEYDTLSSVLLLDPFHRTRPLTALRARVFGRIQSGIANRLRRGSGGDTVEVRIRCEDADYMQTVEAAEALSTHLRRCLTIALTLRTGDDGSALAQQGNRALKQMRRAGFDADRDALAASIALVDGALATATEGFEAHRDALAKIDKREPLATREAADKDTFSNAFARIYDAHLGGPA